MRRWRILKDIPVVGLKIGDIVYAKDRDLFLECNNRNVYLYPPDDKFWEIRGGHVWKVQNLNFNEYYEALCKMR